ncbi:MAG: hypothetical protein IPH86_13820 [bacterium]|nr:hypothetical protein [bacterium]
MKHATQLLLPCLLATCCTTAASSATIHVMEFRQIVYQIEEVTGPGEPDDVGSLLVVYGKDLEVGFLNVAAIIPGLTPDPVWLVANMPLYSEQMGPPLAETAVRPPLSRLGIECGIGAAHPVRLGDPRASPLNEADGELWAQSVPLLPQPARRATDRRREGVETRPVRQRLHLARSLRPLA